MFGQARGNRGLGGLQIKTQFFWQGQALLSRRKPGSPFQSCDPEPLGFDFFTSDRADRRCRPSLRS
jgi:hypothetical protein